MLDYEIISRDIHQGRGIKKQEEWIYLTGSITSRGVQGRPKGRLPEKIDVVSGYGIETFNLEYENPNLEHLYETYGYNVLVIGKLARAHTVKVSVMMDSPDITGKGIVCLNRFIPIGDRVIQVPAPFLYLPLSRMSFPSDIVSMPSPCFEVPYDPENLYYISVDEGACITPALEVFLPKAGGYLTDMPAFYVGAGKDPVHSRKGGTIYTFRGKQVCRAAVP